MSKRLHAEGKITAEQLIADIKMYEREHAEYIA